MFELLITPIATILGVIIGTTSTFYTQSKFNDKAIKLEKQKENRNLLIGCLEIYNEVLKKDGENIVVRHLGARFDSFDTEIYKEAIRPVLYSKFHLVHKDVSINVRAIDSIIAESTYYEFYIDGQEEKLIQLYRDMIKDIEGHIEVVRNKI